jgi:hypothetical protein
MRQSTKIHAITRASMLFYVRREALWFEWR